MGPPTDPAPHRREDRGSPLGYCLELAWRACLGPPLQANHGGNSIQMVQGDTLTVDKLSAAEDVTRVVTFISSRWRSQRWLKIDFSQVGNRPSDRINPYWAETLSNALMADLGRARLILRLPATDNGLKAFARSGLLFAAAQRPSDYTQLEHAGVKPPVADLELWSGRSAPHEALPLPLPLPGPGPLPDSVIDGDFATFLNPHLRVDDDNLAVDVAELAVAPWASEVVGRVAQGLDEAEREALIEDVGQLAIELVLNLGHAFRRLTGLGGEIPAARQRCYVQIYTTDGGGSESFNRLHLVVADVGHGIIRTLKPKLETVNTSFHEFEPGEIIRMLLRDELPEFGRASGLGYKRVVDVVRRHRGSLRLTTGSLDRDGLPDVAVAELECITDVSALPHITMNDALGFIGTTAHALIPLQPRPLRRTT